MTKEIVYSTAVQYQPGVEAPPITYVPNAALTHDTMGTDLPPTTSPEPSSTVQPVIISPTSSRSGVM